MSKPTNDFLEEVARDLEDPAYDVWSKSDLLRFTIDGLGQLVKYLPDEFTEEVDVTLVSGAQQALPNNAVRLVRPLCNLEESVPGRAIREVSMQALDRASPSWRSATPSATTRQICRDPRSQTTFYVSPPGVATNVVRLLCVVQPLELDIDDDLPVDQELFGPLAHYVMFRAYARDGDAAAQPARATAHYAAFLAGVGVEENG